MNNFEISILSFLWRNGPSTAKEIFGGIKERSIAYSTLSFYLRMLENKGAITHVRDGQTYKYHTLLSKSSFINDCMLDILSQFFSGDRQALSEFLKQSGWVTGTTD